MDEKVEEVSLADALAAELEKQLGEEPEETPELEATEVEETDDAEPEEVSPPEHWSEEDQQAFMAMDEGGREWALRLEANAHKGIEEKSMELKKFRDVFEPYKHLIPPGASEEQVIQQLLNAQSVLQRDPLEGIKWLMKSYGVDEKQFLPADTPDDVYIDPEVKALKEQIAELKKQGEDTAHKSEMSRQQAMFAEVQQFKNETNDDGEPLHPHFDSVQGVMAGLLSSGRANDMHDAYRQAVWAVPEYRESEVERKAREFAEKQLEEATEKANKAKKAAKTVQGKSSAKTTSTPKTIAEDLSENYEKSIRGEL